MRRGEGAGAAQIDQQRAVADGGRRRPAEIGAGPRYPLTRPSNGGPSWFSFFIRGKYGGVSGQIGEHGRDERLLAAVLQHRIEAALLADRGELLVADAGAAQRSGAMPRMHLDRSSSTRILLNSESYRSPARRRVMFLAEQIGPADRADKQRVAREQPDRFVGLARQDRDVLRRVTRRVDELDRQIANAEAFAVRRLMMGVLQVGSRSADASSRRPPPARASRRRNRRARAFR